MKSQMSAEFFERLEQERIAKIQGHLHAATFDQIVDYFRELRRDEETVSNAFGTTYRVGLQEAIEEKSASETIAWCKEKPERYEALKSAIRHLLFPAFPAPFASPKPEEIVQDALVLELLRDLLSEKPGPKSRVGPKTRVSDRDARIYRFFELIYQTTDLPKGTHGREIHDDLVVSVLSKVFHLSQHRLRKIINKQRKISVGQQFT